MLQTYARQYYKHVAAFPRYISTIHAASDNIKHRQILLGNLVEEEQGEDNHPELWKRFAEGLGVSREDIDTEKALENTKQLVEGYFDLANSGFATGLGALYAYERQTPEVAKTKIEGLQQFYGVNEQRALSFFTVHMQADEWHTAECANILNELSAEEKKQAELGAIAGAQLLLKFLDGIAELTHCAN